VDAEDPDKAKDKTHFDNLTPLFPTRRYLLETAPEELSTRVLEPGVPDRQGDAGIDRGAAAHGQDGVMQKLANAILKNNPRPTCSFC